MTKIDKLIENQDKNFKKVLEVKKRLMNNEYGKPGTSLFRTRTEDEALLKWFWKVDAKLERYKRKLYKNNVK